MVFVAGDRVRLSKARKKDLASRPGGPAKLNKVGVVRSVVLEESGWIIGVRWDGTFINDRLHESFLELEK